VPSFSHWGLCEQVVGGRWIRWGCGLTPLLLRHTPLLPPPTLFLLVVGAIGPLEAVCDVGRMG